MFNDFLLFVAPFIVVILAIIMSFWIGKKEKHSTSEDDKVS